MHLFHQQVTAAAAAELVSVGPTGCYRSLEGSGAEARETISHPHTSAGTEGKVAERKKSKRVTREQKGEAETQERRRKAK